MPSALSLLQKALSDMGADGLACDGCGCGIEDLAPCGDNPLGCQAAKFDEETCNFMVIEDATE